MSIVCRRKELFHLPPLFAGTKDVLSVSAVDGETGDVLGGGTIRILVVENNTTTELLSAVIPDDTNSRNFSVPRSTLLIIVISKQNYVTNSALTQTNPDQGTFKQSHSVRVLAS